MRLILAVLLALGGAGALHAQTPNNLAPGAQGRDAQWANAGKTAVGTSNTLASKLWFTLREGVLTEVYYPTVDVANVQALQFVVVGCEGSNGRGFSIESEDTTHRLEILDARALSFRQVNEAKNGTFIITKTYTVDPERSTLLIDVEFDNRCRAVQSLYVYYDPSLNNSGMHDSAWTEGDALLASDADKSSALVVGSGIADTTNGYLGTSDGLSELKQHGHLARENRYARAADGNVAQVAEIKSPRKFTLALAFGREPDEALRNARSSLAKGFQRTREEYEANWHAYIETLRRVAPKYQRQFDMSAMVLKAHEDKTFRGAMIASLSVPWGGGASANEPNVGGYHLVWSRDLYQVATAFYALGDKASADRALNYLFTVQQKPDGSFPQNSWLDGRPFWGSLQLDEVSYPLVLAYQLGRTDNETWTKHVRPAADFLIRMGPRTPQERWEEKSGYSPSTIAAEIAGLVCAAEIARRNNDEAAAGIYLAAADDWARNVERWTATTTGVYGDKNYYIRITDNDDPNDGAMLNAGNGGGEHDEREYVDAGFLELVRLGIKRADDSLIAKSLAVVDKVIKVETPHGAAWYRYNHDGYGELDDGTSWNADGKYTGKGRLWALLAGERGEYELGRGNSQAARMRLDALLGFANEGMMIPEQVWDMQASPRADFQFGEGTGSATPLAWSMAEFIRLAACVEENRNLFMPDIVAARYITQSPPAQASADFNAPAEEVLMRMEAGASFKVSGRVAPRARVFASDAAAGTREVPTDAEGRYEFESKAIEGESRLVVAVSAPNGATRFERVSVRGLSGEEKHREERAALSSQFIERLKAAQRSPLIDANSVTFIYRGAAKQVEVVGDFTSWSPRGLRLNEVPGTDIKFYTKTFGAGARAEYKLIADGEWMLDPLNPNSNDNGVGGRNSFFSLPGYRAETIGDEEASNARALESATIESRILKGARKIQLYLPTGYAQSRERYPVLYLQDGSEYANRTRAAAVAAHLTGQKKVAPFIIVFVDPAERMKEYWASDAFADFMAKELVSYVDSHYRTQPRRESRALLGASLGGVTSVWTALKYPELFARVGGQSSSFQIDGERVVAALSELQQSKQSAQPLKFYFDVGRLEPILEVNRRVQVMLAAKNFPVTYREAETGHNWTSWRDRLAEAFIALWSN